MTFALNPNYEIHGQVLGQGFIHTVYSEEGNTLDEIVYHHTYLYAEGNYECDCNKRIFSGLFDDEEIDALGCGSEIKYEKLDLICPEGKVVNLLKEGWFENI